jgi:hypothetical protein
MTWQDTKKIQHTRLHCQIDEILWHPQLVCETLSQSLLEMEETSNTETVKKKKKNGCYIYNALKK